MLSGFNTNVRHLGLLLHVQTEDSGRAHPHVITHLYHGGTILASEKSQYGDRLASPQLVDEVRALMEGQHRAMLKRLVRGEIDARLREQLGAEVVPGAQSAITASGVTGPTAPVPARAVGPDVSDPDPVAAVEATAATGEHRLDEVVLEYLVERAHKRRRAGA